MGLIWHSSEADFFITDVGRQTRTLKRRLTSRGHFDKKVVERNFWAYKVPVIEPLQTENCSHIYATCVSQAMFTKPHLLVPHAHSFNKRLTLLCRALVIRTRARSFLSEDISRVRYDSETSVKLTGMLHSMSSDFSAVFTSTVTKPQSAATRESGFPAGLTFQDPSHAPDVDVAL